MECVEAALALAPTDPVERVAWLNAFARDVDEALDAEYQKCYFMARLQHQLPSALLIAPHGRKRVMAMTRAENERRGRQVRWGDKG